MKKFLRIFCLFVAMALLITACAKADNTESSTLETAQVNNTEYESEVQNKSKMLNLEADLVVVGTDGAGIAAALVAAQAGKRVIILEKNDYIGGNSKLDSGFFALGTKWQKEAAIDVNVDEVLSQVLEFNEYFSNEALTRSILENSSSTLEWIDELGMKVSLQEKSTQFGDNYSYHIYENTEEGFENLYDKLEELGAEIYFNTNMDTLIYADGVVRGVIATNADGDEIIVKAKATMLATDFTNMNEGINAMIKVGAKYIDTATLSNGLRAYNSEVRSGALSKSISGVSVNEKLEVLNIEGNTIKGLYTGGANAYGYYHGEDYSPYEGLASGFDWISGKIAGESILEFLDE